MSEDRTNLADLNQEFGRAANEFRSLWGRLVQVHVGMAFLLAPDVVPLLAKLPLETSAIDLAAEIRARTARLEQINDVVRAHVTAILREAN